MAGRPIRYVYVAGPLSAPTPDGVFANVHAAMEVAAKLRDAGLWPFLPHLCVYWDKKFPADYERWLSLCFAWVERCDALLRIAPSPGTDREVEHALRMRILVFLNADELLAEVRRAG